MQGEETSSPSAATAPLAAVDAGGGACYPPRMDLKKCASELGKKGAAARWAGHSAKRPSRGSKAKKAAETAAQTVRAIAVNARPVDPPRSELSRWTPPLGAGPRRMKPPMAPGKGAWGAPKQLSSGLPANRPEPAASPRGPMVVAGSPILQPLSSPLTGRALSDARFEAFQLSEGEVYYVDPSRSGQTKRSLELDAKLISAQRQKIVATVKIGTQALESGFFRRQQGSDKAWDLSGGFQFSISGNDDRAFPIRIDIEGSNAAEHVRAVVAAYRSFYETLHGSAGKLFRTSSDGMRPNLSISTFGPKDPQPGISLSISPKPSADGNRRVIASMMAAFDSSEATMAGQPDGELLQYARACAALIGRLYASGYTIVVELCDWSGKPISSGFETLEEAISGLVPAVRMTEREYRRGRPAKGSPGPDIVVPDISFDAIDARAATTAARSSPIKSRGGLKLPPNTFGLTEDTAKVIYQAFEVFGVSQSRADKLYAAIAEWAAVGGTVKVSIWVRWYEYDAGGDPMSRASTPGVVINDYRSIDDYRKKVMTPAYFESGSGEIKSMSIDISANRPMLSGRSVSDIESAARSVEDSGFGKVSFVTETDKVELRNGAVWKAVFREPRSQMDSRSLTMTIGYPKRLEGLNGRMLTWNPPQPPVVKRDWRSS